MKPPIIRASSFRVSSRTVCRPSTPFRSLGSALLSLVIIGGLIGCSSDRDGAPVASIVRPVKSITLTAADNTSARSFTGRVEASKRAELAFQIPGLLVELPVKEGQRVSKDDVVARLRGDEFQARLASLEGQLDQARAVLTALLAGERPEERLRRESGVRAANARLSQARADYNRFAALVSSRAVSRSEYDRAEATFRVAQEEHRSALQLLEKGGQAREEDIKGQEAAVRALAGTVDEARIQLADSVLYAPFDGVVAEVFVQRSQTIRAGQPIVRYQNVEEIDVAVDVPEAVMATDIRNPDIVSMNASFPSVPGRQFPVRVREVSQFADPTTQTFLVRFSMPAPPDLSILPGMSATVAIARSMADSAMQVPLSAIVSRPSGESIVWAISADESVAARPVTIGPVTGSQVVITSGLEPGDRIAIAGASFLRDGMKVRELGDALGVRR